MTNGASLRGVEDVLRTIEAKLGDPVVRRKANKVLREATKELEPDFKSALSGYARTGKTVEAVVSSGVRDATLGTPTVKLGFTSPRWTLVHLNEFGYAKKRSPRGFGVMRRFFETSQPVFKSHVGMKLKEEFL